MATLKYRIDRVRVIGSAEFSEASKEELRVLLALIELSGEVDSLYETSIAPVLEGLDAQTQTTIKQTSRQLCLCEFRRTKEREYRELQNIPLLRNDRHRRFHQE